MPNDTVPAAASGLPSPRRGFLRGLLTLPLIGGGVTIIGNPTAAAEPVTDALLDSYDAWLESERRWLQWQRQRPLMHRLNPPYRSDVPGFETYDVIPARNAGARFHGMGEPPAMTRAALVLSAVGCDWRRS
ncbi:hypothetical protein [Methylobacterium sp. J-090]|uniref:hypothetical protein n=1 Tax=Methylobacterium sp. J-090 TaxID=2836666 RepID=UPI001FBB31DB|nr:hypothetical protein [Methylobacterium sp. J-090]MCJ2084338.1 hypothetical protein [Methylobacterium sp. J-090]